VLYRVERDPGYGLLQALWNAVEWELEEAVDALLESGAEVDGVEDEEDGSGQTLLARAVREGKEAAVRLLLDKEADVNRLDRFGASPLHRAARSAEVGIARVLVAAGARLDAVDRTGRTPGQVAEVYGDEAMRRFFAACVDPE
jgi:ankyrin repeat protein